MKQYSGIIKTTNNGKENEMHLSFPEDDMYTAMSMLEGVLRFMHGDDLHIFVRRMGEDN